MSSTAIMRQRILEAAVAAPSADNSQPWRLRWLANGVDLWIDETRSGGCSDSAYLLSDLALGACLENICIQAAALGCETDVALLPDPENAPRWVARVRWREGERRCEALAAAIGERHTDRSFPWRGVSDASVARLRAVAAEGGARLIAMPPGGRVRWRALSILRRAETLRFASRVLHAELFRGVRFDVGWREGCAEGLAPGSLGVERPLRPLFAALRRWPLMRALNALGAAPLLGARAAMLPALGAPHLFLLVAESARRPHILAAGRLLERFWLTATDEGLSVQPFAAVGAVAYGGASLESRWIRRRNALRADVEALCGGGCGLVFVRVGTADRQRSWPRSARRVASDLLFDTSFDGR